MSVNPTSLLTILVVIVTLYCPVSSVITCTNYVNGVEDTRECAYACCLSGGSYAITLTETEVCSDENQKCYNDKLTIPTSCPIKVHEEFEMYGCGVLESCCYLLNETVPEFEHQVPRKNAVCTSDGNCIKYNGQDGFDIWGLEDLKNYQDDSSLTSRNVYCYENCMSVTSSSVVGLEIEDLADLNWPSCSKETVSSCSATTGDVCLFLDVSSKADITVPTQDGFITTPGDMDIRVHYCGKLDDDIKPENKCNIVKEQLNGLANALAVSKIGFENIQTDCGKLGMCDDDCVYEEHKPKKKGGVAWWAILLIIILIVIIVAVIILLYCMFCKKDLVHPKDDEPEMYLEDVENPTIVRLREIERYLDDAIASKDMADLKLTIDIVEQEGFQEELRQKYDTAVRLLEELMARDAEIKRKELEEEERKADEAKKALEEAEKEVLRRQKAEEEAALKRAIEARDVAKVRWARIWPRLQILRALNGINAELVAKAMEEARKAREEEERARRFEEDQAKKAAYCKQLLKDGLAAADEGKLERAIKTTDLTVFQTTIMDTDEELRDLHKKASNELARLRNERIRKEKEAEEKKREEERIAEAQRKEDERLAEAQRQVELRLREEKRLAGLAKLSDIKAALETAISEKDIEKLKKSIADVEDNNLEDDLADLHKQATAMLERLQKIEKIKKNIQELKRPLIAELKSMSSPPVDVHRSMTAAFILMGENREDLRDWNNIVILLGKTGRESVKRKVQGLKVEDVTEEMAAKAEKQILGLTSDEVYEANQAASLFYDWADMICFDKKQESK